MSAEPVDNYRRDDRTADDANFNATSNDERASDDRIKDDELLAAIDAKSLPLSAFTHAQHVRLAWACLRRASLLPAMAEFRRLLIAYATHHGKPTLYHETVTFAYLLLVYERMARTPHLAAWSAFTREHADLLSWQHGPFFKHYPHDIFQNSAARAHFTLPQSSRPSLAANPQ